MRDWIDEVEERLRAAQLDGAAERDVAEELAQHLQDRYEELCARGIAHDLARTLVLRELEDVHFARRVHAAVAAREEPPAVGRPTLGSHSAGLVNDVRFAARMLVRAPVFTAVALLVIALGIGLNTVIFLVVNSVLLQPPAGVREPGRLAAIYTSDFSGPRYGANSYPDMQAVRESGTAFEDVTAFYWNTFTMAGDGWTVQGMGEVVSGNHFRVLGVQPAAGRFFSDEEADPGRTSSVVVISHAVWQTHLGGSRDAVGRTVFIRAQPFTIIGVAPREFGGALQGLRTQLWLPLSAPQAVTGIDATNRGSRSFMARARLHEGADIASAQQRLNVVASRLHSGYPEHWTDINDQPRVLTVVPEAEARVPRQMRGAVISFLGMLMVAVLAVLLIACSNVANLMLSRAYARSSEMGIRLALGATRGRIVRHLLAESVLLAALGGAAGVLLALLATRSLAALRLPGLGVTIQVDMNWRVLAFASAITLATGILFGLAPALQASRAPAPFLKQDARSGSRSRLRHALIVVQVAASLVLLVGGGLFLRSLLAAQNVDTGYHAGNVVIAAINLDSEGYTDAQIAAFYDALTERVSALRGAESVTLARQVPLGMGWSRRWVTVEGYERAEGEDMEIPNNSVAPGFFTTMGMGLKRGRDFTTADREGAPPVLIVSEAFARRFWPNEDAIGKRVSISGAEGPFAEVIGVAPDAMYRSLDDEPQPYFYSPHLQHPSANMRLLARAAGDPAVLAQAVRQEIRQLVPSLQQPSVQTFEQQLALASLPQRVAAIALSALGILALCIAGIGLYGIIAFNVTQRTREFGIRIALGAHAGMLRRLVMGDAVRLVGIGILCGAPLAVVGALVIRGFLRVSPIDPVAFIGVPLLLGVCALLASYGPARRATLQDPASALRTE